jgi:hypothetical protein
MQAIRKSLSRTFTSSKSSDGSDDLPKPAEVNIKSSILADEEEKNNRLSLSQKRQIMSQKYSNGYLSPSSYPSSPEKRISSTISQSSKNGSTKLSSSSRDIITPTSPSSRYSSNKSSKKSSQKNSSKDFDIKLIETESNRDGFLFSSESFVSKNEMNSSSKDINIRNSMKYRPPILISHTSLIPDDHSQSLMTDKDEMIRNNFMIRELMNQNEKLKLAIHDQTIEITNYKNEIEKLQQLQKELEPLHILYDNFLKFKNEHHLKKRMIDIQNRLKKYENEITMLKMYLNHAENIILNLEQDQHQLKVMVNDLQMAYMRKHNSLSNSRSNSELSPFLQSRSYSNDYNPFTITMQSRQHSTSSESFSIRSNSIEK